MIMGKQYIKEIDGVSIIKTSNQINIEKDGMITYKPTEEMILSDGWTDYVIPEPEQSTEEELLEGVQ